MSTMFSTFAGNTAVIIGVLIGSTGLLALIVIISFLLIQRHRRAETQPLSKQERKCIDSLNKAVQGFDEKGEPFLLEI